MTTARIPQTPTGHDFVEELALNLSLSENLLATLNEERLALKAMDTQGLFRLCRHKDTLLAKIHYLDNSLQKAWTTQNSDHAEANIPPEELRLIAQYKERINETRQQIKTSNTVNKRFTEDTLSCLSEAIALLTRPAQPEHTYHIPGRSQARGRTLPSCISCEA
ncbi:MAG: flagellar protein FlgN [Proteobacteria bacterium]|nr:flagellar protein FlgN [Desulfobulbaceae bacterium]MBU4153679.1 flagellar protein FlgN [Pseudomonadota bacterium]MDP2105341.1 flagellar export chaperone FlgN [Desulfobulbaceae bacterium]